MTRQQAHPAPAGGERQTITVWDPVVRLFHWGLVLAVSTALATGFLAPENWLDVHLAAGGAVAALLVLRLVWGLAGSSHARFRAFVYGPAETLAYARSLVAGAAPHYRGHNPLGALMIFALLGLLGALVVSGLVDLGGVEKRGALAAFTSFATGRSFGEIHEFLAFAALGLVALHLAGVAFSSRHEGIDLPRAMVTGEKPALDPADRPRPAAARTVPALGLVAIVVAAGAGATAALAGLPGLGVPQEPLDAAYKRECGDCHIAFHPSLANAADWTAMMAGLDRHFGEDASLPPETVAALTSYLTTHAAGTVDTKAANWLRRRDAAEPLRITATPFWKRRHGDIPDAVFASRAVGARSACGACHRDAETGLFADAAIAVPDPSSNAKE